VLIRKVIRLILQKEIEENRNKTKRHIETVRDEYNSLSIFIDDSVIIESKKIVKNKWSCQDIDRE
jgi:hypothetical protein